MVSPRIDRLQRPRRSARPRPARAGPAARARPASTRLAPQVTVRRSPGSRRRPRPPQPVGCVLPDAGDGTDEPADDAGGDCAGLGVGGRRHGRLQQHVDDGGDRRLGLPGLADPSAPGPAPAPGCRAARRPGPRTDHRSRPAVPAALAARGRGPSPGQVEPADSPVQVTAVYCTSTWPSCTGAPVPVASTVTVGAVGSAVPAGMVTVGAAPRAPATCGPVGRQRCCGRRVRLAARGRRPIACDDVHDEHQGVGAGDAGARSCRPTRSRRRAAGSACTRLPTGTPTRPCPSRERPCRRRSGTPTSSPRS